jgi:hypothetical protein
MHALLHRPTPKCRDYGDSAVAINPDLPVLVSDVAELGRGISRIAQEVSAAEGLRAITGTMKVGGNHPSQERGVVGF